MNGFVLNDVTEIETVEPEMSKGEFLCAEESNVRDVSKFEFEYKNTIEL